ncbi:hypothetical protein GCM10023264_26960 [Sphingomonas daechungensis]|uniref:DUF6265 domain-containing protein n=1 Tax=Sphingomonas daechungensis TaxID=1176646 RepID=A0ABX6T0P1_9SPHN|nr:DUF6265 family protein [Sphingomonas daechungensis]QNP43402.1 hypothetical protein H9L15_00650 [Sphingomonas daechungensis]
MLLMLAAFVAEVTPRPVLPVWLTGCWESEAHGKWIEECWNDPRAGIMMGSGRSGRADALADWEVMQIQIDPASSKMTFYGSPEGQNRTAFEWTPSSESGVTFVNSEHDYPQKIRYWREGRELVAEVSLADGGKARRWRYQPKTD